MKRLWAFCLFLVLLISCNKGLSKADLHWLNGYWEIEEVEGPGGRSKTYGLNETIDYIALNGLDGYRKKVQPQADGTFLTSDDLLPFSIREIEGRFFFVYSKGDTAWEEQLIALDSADFEVVNRDHITYHYKRYQPLKINE